tara:strand:- start:115 stop:318 length:204 start_codon:yes stop_codon:yes gene_type:complete
MKDTRKHCLEPFFSCGGFLRRLAPIIINLSKEVSVSRKKILYQERKWISSGNELDLSYNMITVLLRL